jgi:quercetin dioxygenase-like cupin family protein
VSGRVPEPVARVHRWDEIALERVTEMVSRKVVSGAALSVSQVYLRRGTLVPLHDHPCEQMTCVLQGALRVVAGGEEHTVREGEVLHVMPGAPHQVEALDDTFVLDLFSPPREAVPEH